MFNWFKNIFDGPKHPGDDNQTDMEKIGNDMKKVIPFPDKVPYIVPPTPAPEEPAKIFYRLGVTDKNRIAFSMGPMEITMTRAGVQNLIEQLQVFRDQLSEDSSDE